MYKFLMLGLMCVAGCTENIEEEKMHPLLRGGQSGGWQVSKKLTMQNVDSKASLECVFPTAGNYTVQFGLVGLIQGSAFPNVYADVEWSVEGGTIYRRVSVINGTALTGNAQAVKVTVFDGSLTGSAQYDVRVTVAPGVRGSNVQPPFYSPVIVGTSGTSIGSTIVLPGANQSFNVPPDIGIISAFTTAALNDTSLNTPILDSEVLVQQFSTTGIKQYDPRIFNWVPIVPNISSMTFFNNMAAPATGVMFSVAFGIEG